MIMLRQLLSSFSAQPSDKDAAPELIADLQPVAPMPEPKPQLPRSRRYPRSVCTTLKDLCEL